MADIRIKDLATTAASTASDDFVAVDGSANGTRKLNAYSPTFGGNLTVSATTGTNSFASVLSVVGANIQTNRVVAVTGGTGNSYFDGASIVNNNVLVLGSSGSNYGFVSNVNGTTWSLGYGATKTSTGTAALSWTDSGAVTLAGNLTVSGTGTSTFAGNLGLKVTPSSWNTDYRVYELGGGGAWFNNGGNTFIALSQNLFVDTSSINKYIATAAATRYRQSAGEHFWDIAASGTAGNTITFTQAMTLTSGGNLLIGTTTDGGQKLQVSGTATVSGNTTLTSTTASSSTSTGALVVSGGVGVAGAIYAGGTLQSTNYAQVAVTGGDTIALCGNDATNTYYLGVNYLNNRGTETVPVGTSRASWRWSFNDTDSTGNAILGKRSGGAAAGTFTDLLTITQTGDATFAGNITVNGAGPYTLKSRTIINRSDNTSATFGHVSLTRGTGAGTTAALATTGDASNGVASVSLQLSDADRFVVTSAGTVVLGTQASLATNATDGFTYIPVSAGAPTGTPTAYTGKVAMEYDTTNNKLYIYNGGWKSVTLA
jgi:hypothetical protein